MVMPRTRELTPTCFSDTEIWLNIQMLKDDSDVRAKELTRSAKFNPSGAMY